ncbi:MAG: DUF58 domain-containing protein [Thermaerobacter sp.]|nr:DUF58 domain-containing protein [Thermaerobacter sp.]
MKWGGLYSTIALFVVAMVVSHVAPGAIWEYVWRVVLLCLAVSLGCLWLAGSVRPHASAWPEHAESGDFAGIDVEWLTPVPGFWLLEANARGSSLRAQGWFAMGRQRVRLEEAAARRGVHSYSVRLTYRDPFGLFSRRLASSPEVELAVHPRTVPLGRIGALRGLRGTMIGARRAQRSEAPSGVRRYLPGDRLAEVHWPQTLRTGEVQVRDAYTRGSTLRTIALDARSAVYADAQSFELAVSVAASLALSFSRRGDAVALLAGDTFLSARSATPARILDVLTRVTLGEGGDGLGSGAQSLIYVGSAQGAAAVRTQRVLSFTVAVGRGAQGEDLPIPDWPSLYRLARGARAVR